MCVCVCVCARACVLSWEKGQLVMRQETKVTSRLTDGAGRLEAVLPNTVATIYGYLNLD